MKKTAFFDALVWQEDRMLFRDLVFRLEHYKTDKWDLGENCFMFYKIKGLVDQYAQFWKAHEQFSPRNLLELGIWGGGSMVFWFELLQPETHIGIDILQKENNPYFEEYITARGLEERLKTVWKVDQGDCVRLREIVEHDFSGELDIVIDDASHKYGPTKRSFEILFPLLRPGGLYIIEDWAWAHWQEFQTPESPMANERALTDFIVELVEATGSSVALIGSLHVFQGFAVVERGELPLGNRDEFCIDHYISRRSPQKEPWIMKIIRVLKQRLIKNY
jgi:SAM-dependent methyltransferase